MMDSIFFLTLLVIFIGALFSNIMKWSKKDLVLKDLQNFHASFEMRDGKHIWGEANIYANGMELLFSRQEVNTAGDPITSYIFHNDDIDQIRVIYRNQGELSLNNQQRRKEEIERVSNPGFVMVTKRKFRILFNMFNDAIGEALSVFISRMKGGGVGGALFTTQGENIQKLGTTALSVVGNAYDPNIERFINRRVVVSLDEGDKKEEFCGFLKEYSSAWMSVVDCKLSSIHHIKLDDIKRLTLQRDMDFHYLLHKHNEQYILDIDIHYYGVEPLTLKAIKGGSYLHNINKTLNHGQSVSLTLDELPENIFMSIEPALLPLEFFMVAEERTDQNSPIEQDTYQSFLPDFELEFSSSQHTDVYIPRAHCVLRHASV